MWTISIILSVPVNPQLDYRMQLSIARDAETAPQPEYDTADILLWQKDEEHPEDTPQITEYFTNVCSVADMTLYPVAGGADLQYRTNVLDMIFRSESLMRESLQLILDDITQLEQAILGVNSVVTDGDFDTAS